MDGKIVNNPAVPLYIQQLRNSLDLSSALEQIREIQKRLQSCSNSYSKGNDEQAVRQLIKSRINVERRTVESSSSLACIPSNCTGKLMYNFRRVYKERQWLKDVLLSDSSSEEEETDCDLQSHLQLHHRTNNLKEAAKHAKYYGAGLLSRLDMYCEKRPAPKKVISAVEHNITKRTKVGHYAKSRSKEIAARRQSVWNFIATMEVPKIQKVKATTRKENLALLQKVCEDSRTAVEKGTLRPCEPQAKASAVPFVEKAQRDSRPAAKELIVFCPMNGRQRQLYESVKKHLCIDDLQIRKSSVTTTWRELIKICDHPESYECTSNIRQAHEMQLNLSFPEKLLLLASKVAEGSQFEYETLGLSWLKLAAFSNFESTSCRMLASVQSCLIHEWTSDKTKKLLHCFLWIWPTMPLSLPSIVMSPIMQGVIVTYIPHVENDQIHLREVQPPLVLTNNFCDKIKAKLSNCNLYPSQRSNVLPQALVDTLTEQQPAQRTMLTTRDGGKLKALDMLLKKHARERLSICTHSERLIKLLEMCLRYWGYNCRRSSSQLHQSGTFVLLVNASTLRVSHRIFSANVVIVYSYGWVDSRSLVQQLMGSNQHKCIVYHLICKSTVEHALLNQLLRKRKDNKLYQEEHSSKVTGTSQQQLSKPPSENTLLRGGSKRPVATKQEVVVEKGMRSTEHKWKLSGLTQRKRRNDSLKTDSINRIKKFKEDRIKMIIAKRKSWKRTRRSKAQ